MKLQTFLTVWQATKAVVIAILIILLLWIGVLYFTSETIPVKETTLERIQLTEWCTYEIDTNFPNRREIYFRYDFPKAEVYGLHDLIGKITGLQSAYRKPYEMVIIRGKLYSWDEIFTEIEKILSEYEKYEMPDPKLDKGRGA